jgi:hypothetical protein
MRTVKTAALLTVSLSIFGGLTALSPDPALATTECTAGFVNTTSNGNIRIVRFTAPNSGNGSCTWDVPENVFVVDYLVVAGGGGGGSGGGGGGGVVTSWDSNANPQTVEPGATISVTVGAGGTGGAGGSGRYSGAAGTAHQTLATNGADSVFGSVTAVGGGRGGSDSIGATGGSSGGDSYDRSTTGGAVAAASTVVGAASFGNDGGGSPAGGYSSGGGGGGAGASGGNARIPGGSCFVNPGSSNSSTGQYGENCASQYLAGGNGGSGKSLDISGSSVEYGCGGGGGVNANSNKRITNGGGSAGCSGAGAGSSYGNYFTNYTPDATNTTPYMAGSGSAGTGGGGGGTDPEDTRGGAGGSGVVVIRYTITDSRCPNDGTNSATTPLACPTDATVQANGASTNVSVLGSPISFSSGGTLSVRSRPTANPTSGNMSATVNGSNIVISVPSGSSLIGGTYPVVYRISQQGGVTSDSYILVRVEDPTQLTPGTIPLDPRETGITFPRIELGAAPNVLVCMTLQDNNTDGLSLAATATTGVTIANPSTRRITFSGTNASVESALNAVTITGSGTGILVPTNTTRVLDVNVTNTNNGGNGSCSVGTESTITLNKLSLTAGQRLRINLD